MGKVSASEIIRSLLQRDKPSTLARAIGDLGRIQTPAITAGDGGQTSVPGFNPLFGTSAAAPTAAAIAALVWSKKGSRAQWNVKPG